LLTNEALDVLALRPGASAVEIKGAYRDLVKVWHPDRFGSDPRLREKAEDKLRQINEAYLVLQSDRTGGTNEADGASVSMRGDAARGWDSSSVPRTHRRRRRRAKGISGDIGWLYACVAIALGLTAGYVAIEHGTTLSVGPASVSRQMVDASGAAIPAVQTAGEGAAAGGDVAYGELPGQSVPAKDSGGSKAAGSPPFQVRVLSNAEMALLGSACSRQEGLKDPTAYETCVRTQLDVIADARSKPDLSSLSAAERESIESVCSEAKRLHGTDRYHLCLINQMAELAAEPARPDLSGLSEADRSSIEGACSKAKYREGPAAYERCRAGFVELLAKTK
jgi:DnaJ domain